MTSIMQLRYLSRTQVFYLLYNMLLHLLFKPDQCKYFRSIWKIIDNMFTNYNKECLVVFNKYTSIIVAFLKHIKQLCFYLLCNEA